MKKLVFTLFLIVAFTGGALAQLNEYKYIIVPKQFDAFKKENQYQTSTLVKYLLVQRGFNAVYADALPEELIKNRCLALVAQINNESSMFVTKVSVVFKDCKLVDIFSTQLGVSKEKDYKLSYAEALREAFKSLDGMDYSYTPGGDELPSEPITVSYKNDVKIVEENTTVQAEASELGNKVTKETSAAEIKDQVVVEQQASPEQQSYKNKEPQQSQIKKEVPTVTVAVTEEAMSANTSDILYAQPITNGFQLVDSTPKVILQLQRTSRPNEFLAGNETKHGLLYKRGDAWIFEYYEGANLMSDQLNIKF